MSACTQCGIEFSCGVADGADATQCWCMALPLTPAEKLRRNADGKLQDCLCLNCLQALQIELANPSPES